MKASVIVPYVRTPRKLKTFPVCMKSLEAQDVEIITEEGGVSAELSAASRAKGDVLLFTDCDCYVPHDWVQRHMMYYPRTWMVLGAPSLSFKFLSFRNFSIRRDLFLKIGLNDVPNHDFDFALRLMKAGLDRNYVIDSKIRVFHDDAEPTPPGKLFSYASNIVLLMRKHRVLPSREDFAYLNRPMVLLGMIWGLSMPTSYPFRAFRRRGRYANDSEY